MDNIKIFEKHFRKGMIVKDFEAFKRTHPTLLKCILKAMDEVLLQTEVSSVERKFCTFCKNEVSRMHINCQHCDAHLMPD